MGVCWLGNAAAGSVLFAVRPFAVRGRPAVTPGAMPGDNANPQAAVKEGLLLSPCEPLPRPTQRIFHSNEFGDFLFVTFFAFQTKTKKVVAEG